MIDLAFDLVPTLDLWGVLRVAAVPSREPLPRKRSYALVAAAAAAFLSGGTVAEVLS
jgi:hypothetical protein